MIKEFLIECYKIKELKRSGWLKKVNIEEPESVASHSFGMLLIASLFFDDHKLFKKIVLHDLAEVITGDLTPEEKAKDHEEVERKAFSKLVENLEEGKKEEIIKLYEESKKDPLIKDLDKLDMAFQALYYKRKGYPLEKLLEFVKSASSIKDERLRALYEEILEEFKL